MKLLCKALLLLVAPILGHGYTRASQKANVFAGAEKALYKKIKDLDGRADADMLTNEQGETTEGAEQFAWLAQQERQLLRDGHDMLRDIHAVKAGVDQALGETDTTLIGKLQKLMDNIGDAQRDIVHSQAEASSHAARLAASIRKTKPSTDVTAFAQASQREGMGTKDPVRRAKLAQQAEAQIKEAKSELQAAYGSDNGKAENIMSMMDKLQSSMQGLEKGADEDAKFHTVAQMKAEEAKMFAEDEHAAGITPNRDGEVSLAQTSTLVQQSDSLASILRQAMVRLIRPPAQQRSVGAAKRKVHSLRRSVDKPSN